MVKTCLDCHCHDLIFKNDMVISYCMKDEIELNEDKIKVACDNPCKAPLNE